jgi:hypothetical protein
MTFSLTWLPAVLTNAGLKVALVPGWEDRGRAEAGETFGVICHHTGVRGTSNMPTLNALINGRAASPGAPALSGPLAQLGLGRDGTFYVVAAGKANHAGAGIWQGITAGNTHFIGIEAENGGSDDDPWPEVQLDAYRRGVAAILKHIGRGVDFCAGHKEYAPGRKDDPSFNMDVFRAGVSAILGGSAPVPVLIPRSDPKNRPTLRRGDSGPEVTRLQTLLHVEGPGIFGPQTEVAVRDFQRGEGLVPDGIVGPKTWDLLEP